MLVNHLTIKILLILTLCLAVGTFVSPTFAEPTPTINYQGKLTDPSGVAVPNGTYNMRFWLLQNTSQATTSALWTESLTASNQVQVTNGLFSVMLGSTSPLTSVNFNQPLYLGVEIGGTGAPAWDGEMSPRKVLGTVPAAFESYKLGGVASSSFLRSDQADTMSATTASTLLTITQSGTGDILNLFDGGTEVFTVADGGNVGIGTTSPYAKLSVAGRVVGQYFTATSTTATSTLPNLSTNNLALTGRLYDINAQGGTSGQILSSTGTGVDWIATSTLGLGNGSFTGLSQTQDTLTANRVIYTNSGATSLTDSANFTYDGTNLNVGATNGIAWGGTRYITANTTSDNITFGENAGATFTSNTINNIALGFEAGRYASTTNSDFNNFIGYYAGRSNTGAQNNVFGYEAGFSNTGAYNNLFGVSAGYFNTGTRNNVFGYYAGVDNTGSYNNLFGQSAGYSNTGSSNNFFGLAAGYSNTGSYNEMFGYQAGFNLQATSSIIIGGQAFRGGAGSTPFQALNNVALGYRAGYAAQTGSSNNILLGYQAADNLTTGNNNIVIGYDVDLTTATANNTLNIGNLIFGTSIDGTGTTLSSGNVGIGTTSPYAKLSVAGRVVGQYFTATSTTATSTLPNLSTNNLALTGRLYDVNTQAGTSGQILSSTGTGVDWIATSTLGLGNGTFTGLSQTQDTLTANRIIYTNSGATSLTDSANFTYDGTNLSLGTTNGIAWGGTRYLHASSTNDSIVFGENAGATFKSNTIYNVALGFEAGRYASTTNSDYNNFIGYFAGYSNTGSGNNLLGSYAGRSNTGSSNNLFGNSAGLSNTGSDNNFFGYLAGYSNTGSYNNLSGNSAGYANTGSNNNLIGLYAGYANTGSDNNLFGQFAGSSNTGSQNNLFGYLTGGLNTGSYNDIFGTSAGSYNIGNYNEMFGFEAGYNLQATSSIVIGAQAFRGAVTDAPFEAVNNVAIGYRAGYNATTSANNNILLGYQAADNLTTGNNNIVIGYDVDLTTATANNTLNIGNLIFGNNIDGTGTTLSSGNIGIGTTSPYAKLSVAGQVVASYFTATSTTATSTFANHISIGIGKEYRIGGYGILSGSDADLNVGYGNTSLGAYGATVGFYNSASGAGDAMAFGEGNVASGSGSSAFGVFNTATGNGSSVFGASNSTSVAASDASAFGRLNQADGSQSSAFGYNNIASADYASVFGSNVTNTIANSVQIGPSNTAKITILSSGNVGIGTTSPYAKLSVAGQVVASYFTATSTTATSSLSRLSTAGLALTGRLFDINTQGGTSGQILSSTGTGVDWIATSTLGLGNGSFTGLSQTQDTLTANRIIYTNSGATSLTDSANFTYDGTNLSLGSTNGIAWGGTRFLYASSTNDSVIFGENAGATFNSGTIYNVALGLEAGRYASTSNSDYNNFMGYQAGYFNTGSLNNLFGRLAGYQNTGSANNLFGESAGRFNTGSSNNLFGQSSGYANTGSYNNLFGSYAGRSNTGSYNNLFGYSTGFSNTGTYNNLFGHSAGYSNTGSYNEMFGYEAGYNLQATSSVIIGGQALRGGAGTTPFQALNNVALGYRAGYAAQTGSSNNILLGYQAADNLTTGNNNIVIGYDVDLTTAATDNTLNIGNLIFGTGIDGTGTTLSSGKIGIGTTSPYAKLSVAGKVVASNYVATSTTANGFAGSVGSATLPTYSFSTDPNTGFYHTGVADTLAVTTGGVERMRINALGEVGIGETSPGGKLHVNKTSTTGGVGASEIGLYNNFNDTGVVTSGTDNTHGIWNQVSRIGAVGGTTNTYGLYNLVVGGTIATDNVFGSVNTISELGTGTLENAYGSLSAISALTSITNGYGFYSANMTGVSNSYGLYVESPTSATNAYGAYVTDLTTTNTNSYGLYLANQATAGTNKYAIYSAGGKSYFGGNVGIGTTSPYAKLSVNGSAVITGRLTASYFIATSTTATSTFGDVNITTASNRDNWIFWGGENFLSASSTLRNTFLGLGAGTSTTVGNWNTFIGWHSGQSNTIGTDNTFIGKDSGALNISGSQNVFIGQSAGGSHASGNANIYIGHDAGLSNTSGDNNVYLGKESGQNSNGSDNSTYIGSQSGYAATGDGNSFLGRLSGRSVTTGTNNTFLGYNAGYTDGTATTSGTLTNATAIGYNAQVTRNNSLILGGIGAYGVNVGIGTTSPYAKFSLNYTDASDTGPRFLVGSSTATDFIVADDGYVGIGKNNPGSMLTVLGGDISLREDDDGNDALTMYASNLSGAIDFKNGGITKVSIQGNSESYFNGGNVGIGTTSPSSKLNVVGTTTIGDGTTGVQAGLQIGYGGICVDDDGYCAAPTRGLITSVSTSAGHSDLAEMYFSNTNLHAGEVVTLSGGLSIDRAEKGGTTPVLGVVSTGPGFLLGFDDTSLTRGEAGYPVALAGRVPVKLSTENGPITRGDSLMLSSLPGVAMKATSTGITIGIALEDFDDNRYYSDTYINQYAEDLAREKYQEVTDNKEAIVKAELRGTPSETRYLYNGTQVQLGQVVMFVKLGDRWVGDAQLASLGVLMSTSSLTIIGENENETVLDRLVVLANRFVDGILSVIELRANRVEVAEELCIDDVCVTADDLRALLKNQSATVGASQTNSSPTETNTTETGGQTQGSTAGNSVSSSTEQVNQVSTSTESVVESIPVEADTTTATLEGGVSVETGSVMVETPTATVTPEETNIVETEGDSAL